MNRFILITLVAAFAAGCASGSKESGSLARSVVWRLEQYGAEFTHINLDQPAIGIPQLFTSWRAREDSGGFALEFNKGTYKLMEGQLKHIFGPGSAASSGTGRVWALPGVAHVDLVELPGGEARLTCRRAALNLMEGAASSPVQPPPHDARMASRVGD